MTRWAPPIVLVAALTALHGATPITVRAQRARSSIVIVTGQEAAMPIPTLMEGAQANVGNQEVADQLFLRLAGLGPGLATAGDEGFLPLLARSWSRRDSLTLVFELDPRARWHDGAPVTARDVVFTFGRARDPALCPKLATLTRHIASVTAEGDRRVAIRFSLAYAEQFYDATFHVAPLPAHLLADIPPHQLAGSPFVNRPVGNGPYKWVQLVAGSHLELVRNDSFFLGRPGIERVIVRVARDGDARLNLLLAGQADAMDNIPPPLTNLQRVAAQPEFRMVPVPSPTLGYLLFNQRDPRDRDRPHPILSDREVRRAILLALDRRVAVRAVFGPYGEVPFGPASPVLWIRHGAPDPVRADPAAARRLLASRGWRDDDGDGTLERDGVPLLLELTLPNTSPARRQMALLVQEQLRRIGVRLELAQFDAPVWNERRNQGRFDLDFSAVSQDPSPSSLVQSWSCAGGNNVARFCDPVVDSLLEQAIRGRGETRRLWHAILRRIEDGVPAAFMYAPIYVYAVHRRYSNVSIRPESSWISLWRWSEGRAAQGGAPPGY